MAAVHFTQCFAKPNTAYIRRKESQIFTTFVYALRALRSLGL